MRIDFDKRLDKEYPEPPECAVNEKDCSFDVEYVCHDCGKPICESCAVGVKHQPRPAKYSYRTVDDDVDMTQFHCNNCAGRHSIDMRIIGAGGLLALLGLLFAGVGRANIIPLTVVGVVMIIAGMYVSNYEYSLKKHRTDHT